MKRIVAAQLGLMVILLASTTYGQTPEYNENLKPFSPLIGQWTGHFTLQKDLTDLGNAGDKIFVRVIYNWTKNRNAMTLSADVQVDGQWVNVTNGFIVWDVLKKKITGVDAYADGGHYRYEVETRGGKLLCRGHGSTGEGVPTELTVKFTTVTKDSFTGQFINQKEGDKKLLDGVPYELTRVKE